MTIDNIIVKCKVCSDIFTPTRPMQKVCSPACAMQHARAQSEKKQAKAQAAERKAVRLKLQALQTKPWLVKKAQAAFNAFIRARDVGKPCISCGRPLGAEPNTYDCGHYRSVGSAPHMRFVEENAHGQCKRCNNHLGGNHVEYRKWLIQRVGLQEVERIERDQVPRRYTKEGLIELARHYRQAARKLRSEHEA
jgi:hypothetical protein